MSATELIFKKKKALDIIESLLKGSRHIREIREIVGGSATTTVTRLRELEQLGIVEYKESDGFPFRRVVSLTEQGKAIAYNMKILKSAEVVTNAYKLKSVSPVAKGRKRWMLALLHAVGGAVPGSTRLEKLMFILKNDLPTIEDKFYEFKWYHYGPFSAEVLEDAKKLEKLGLLEIIGEVFAESDDSVDDYRIRWTYSLTVSGRRLASKIFEGMSLPERWRLEALRPFNDLPLPKLLDYVYANYKGIQSSS